MKSNNGFTIVWVVEKKGNAPRRFFSRDMTRRQGSFEVFGRFQPNASDRLYTVAEVHMVDPVLQAQVAAVVTHSAIVARPRRRFVVLDGSAAEVAAPPN